MVQTYGFNNQLDVSVHSSVLTENFQIVVQFMVVIKWQNGEGDKSS